MALNVSGAANGFLLKTVRRSAFGLRGSCVLIDGSPHIYEYEQNALFLFGSVEPLFNEIVCSSSLSQRLFTASMP